MGVTKAPVLLINTYTQALRNGEKNKESGLSVVLVIAGLNSSTVSLSWLCVNEGRLCA